MSYSTWPPQIGHRVVVVMVVDGAVCARVGRVTGYACIQAGSGESRSVCLSSGSGRVWLRENVNGVYDLDSPYSFGVVSSAGEEVLDEVRRLAAALLPPAAAVPVDPVEGAAKDEGAF